MEGLRAHLSSALPEYMVPAAYVQLDALPLTASGKLDRKALPDTQDSAYSRREYEAPVGEVETTLAQIWSEVLGVERVGRHDNFFDLGGHSLLAVRVWNACGEVVLTATCGLCSATPILVESPKGSPLQVVCCRPFRW